MKTCITIPSSALKAAELFTSKDALRYVLNGVLLEITSEKEAILVATEGRMLFAIRLTIPEIAGFEKPLQVILPSTLTRKVRAGKDRELVVGVDMDGSKNPRVSIQDPVDGFEYGCAPIDGIYPAWRSVVPKGKHTVPTTIPCFNTEYAAMFSKAAFLLGLGKAESKHITLRQVCPEAPYLVEIGPNWGTHDVLGVIRPVRNERKGDLETPSWAIQE